MPSQRNSLGDFNVNGSKNTRMEMTKSFLDFDFRKDEIQHIGRYMNSANTMVSLAKQLGRPIRVLDIGCGEMNTVRLFYRSILEKKTDIIESYTGMDIDYKMKENAFKQYGQCYEACNADMVIRDLTVEPILGGGIADYYDLIICFEFCEHIKQEFLPPILREAHRVLSPSGKALFSTPNSNGSNAKLPKDHIYEYSYEELTELFKEAGFTVDDAVGCCVNISRIPEEEKDDYAEEIDRIYKAFGYNSAFASVAVAPLFSPKYCKNVVYHLSK
jgi:SAM-dependent methyltransferase